MAEQTHGKRPMSVRFAPLAPSFEPRKHCWRCAAPVKRGSQFNSGAGRGTLWVPGKAQRGLSTRPIIERPLVRPQLPGPAFMRASEPVSCWPHKPCEWRSTRQPATISGSRFIPPSSPGRPLRSRRRSEKPEKHVRLVLLAPSVTVAEWLRRQTVDRSTRVRFSPVTPKLFTRMRSVDRLARCPAVYRA